MQGDFDNEGAADVGGAHEADHAAGDADQCQGGLIHRTSGGAHWKQETSKARGGKNLGSGGQWGLLLSNPANRGGSGQTSPRREMFQLTTPVSFILLEYHVTCQLKSQGLSLLVALRVNSGQPCASSLHLSWDRFTKKS